MQTNCGLDDALARVLDLTKDVQTLSYRLHSSKLEYLGVVEASKSFCKEFSQRNKVEVDFQSEHVQKDLPKEIALCLYAPLPNCL